MSPLLDTNIPIRHLTGDPPAQARRAAAFLKTQKELTLTDLIFAEVVYILESYYERPKIEVARLARSLLAFDSIVAKDEELLLRGIELYETLNLDFADAYLAATAEFSGIEEVASLDQTLDRVPNVRRIEP